MKPVPSMVEIAFSLMIITCLPIAASLTNMLRAHGRNNKQCALLHRWDVL
jgi:hypothetical protein